MSGVFGLLNLYKPPGPTSHDLVVWVRRGTGVKKVGHAGTLDPAAAGVLVLCLGPATRLSEYVMGSPKTYVARVHFGVETDTYDAEGAVTAQDSRPVTRAEVEAALDRFRGEIAQVPPMVSAIRQGGRRLYELARAGQTVERAARAVTISRLVLTAWEPPVAVLEIDCSPGTYIRSLAHDLGQALGCGAHLTALTRTAAGEFRLEDSHTLEALGALAQAGRLEEVLLPPETALTALPVIVITPEQEQAVRFGQTITLDDAPDAEMAQARDAVGRFIAVMRPVEPGVWRPKIVFASAD